MAEMKAPEQNQALARIAELLRLAEQDSGPEFLPQSLNVMGLFRDFVLPSSRTMEKLSYGDPLFRMPTQSNIPITTNREYAAEVLGMAPAIPAVSRATTKVANEAADQLVRTITGNPQATATAALEAAGQMAPLSRIFSPEQAKKILPETKIVDESGNPKLMYHATKENFEDFEPGVSNAIFATSDNDEFLRPYLGRFFNTKTGKFEYSEGANIRPVYIDAKNPFDYENKKDIKAVVKWIKENIPDSADVADSIGEKLTGGEYFQIERPSVQAAIKGLGYDGFYVKENELKNIAVFDPSKIRSALSDSDLKELLGSNNTSKFTEDVFSNPLMEDTTK